MSHIEQYTTKEFSLFKKLNSPRKIQDYLEEIELNFEQQGDTCMSPRRVIREQKAHCIEGAMLAAAVLEFHGQKPLVLHLKTHPYDYDHLITLYRQFGCWGAISKTNHAVLRYRDPVYKTIRELVLSYFHEYTDDNGRKSLREYTDPINLNRFNKYHWRTTEEELWDVSLALHNAPHKKILTRQQIANLRKTDPIEIEAGKLVSYKKK